MIAYDGSLTAEQLARLVNRRDPDNPYVLGGISFLPDVVHRVFSTPDDVARQLAEMMSFREYDVPQVAEMAGVAVEDVAELLDYGRGDLATFQRICEALGVSPVTVPPEIVLTGRRDHD